MNYRPFDERYTYYTGNSKGFHCMPRGEVMKHFLKGENVGLVVPRMNQEDDCFFVTKHIMGHKLCSAYDSNSTFPLYLYPETNGQQTFEAEPERKPNLKPEIVQQIAKELALTFTHEKEEIEGTFAPIDLLDYIYAVLHSPSYREKYKEFLKIDFPRVPFPNNKDTFWQLVKLGGEIRQIHLLESDKVEAYITTYPKDGDNVITRKLNKNDWDLYDNEKQLGRIWINDTQYFDQIPLIAWTFYIGGYQPAQKWLKDRRGRKLNFEDILHYQKIIVALSETDRLMKEIDKISLE